MDEQQRRAYLELVQALLQCESGQEAALLQAQPDMVDEGLVAMLLEVAEMVEQENEPESTGTIRWLREFAAGLAESLGLTTNAAESPDQLAFLLKVLQTVASHGDDQQAVYPLLKQNLQFLNDDLVELLKAWTNQKFAEVGQGERRAIAMDIGNFSILISDFPLGNKAVNMDLSIAGYEILLGVFTATTDSETWAATQYNLANAYSDRIRGDRGENLELSIAFYEVALKVYTKKDLPIQWAQTQNNLANAYSDRIRGDRGENLELSIACCEATLKVYTKKDLPIQWAQTQNNLAAAYSDRIRGDRGENLELSVACYEAALEVLTKKDLPIQWAMTQNNLANAYSERIRGDRGENLEKSIACYEAALEVLTKKDLPIQWATTQNNLANAYLDRIRGDRGENLELSIACYEAALKVYTKKDLPIQWADTQNNLANAYSQRIREDRAENLELSIACYEAALEVRTRKDLPIQWAQTQNNLANAYSDRIRGDRAENLELSVACYEAALEVRTRKDLPIQWADTQNNLANAYSQRIRGDRAENLDLSIACYEAALKVRTKKDLPIQWAQTQNNLAAAYSERIRGDRGENLEKSIARYEAALKVYTKKDLPIQWADTQNNLANAYSERIRGDRGENLEKSIACYEAALEVYTQKDLPIQWAMTQNNLATAYLNRIRGDRGENLELSIACYEAALEVRTKKDLPIQWAETQANIASLCTEINPDRAIYHYQQSLQIFQVNILPINCLKDSRRLGNIYFMQSKWLEAIAIYEVAMEAAELSRSWSLDDSERQRVLRDALSVYENAIQCAVNLKDYQRAIEYTERVRSRQLVELMASKDLYSDAQVPPEIQAYLAEYQKLNQSIEDLRGDSTKKLVTIGSRDSKDLRRVNEQVQQAEARKQYLYRQIRTYDPVLAGFEEISSISYSEIQKLITNVQIAILAFYSTDDDTHIFILKQNQDPEVFTVPSQGKQALQQWLIENWLIPYKQKDNEPWREQMPVVLAEVADRLQINQLITNHLAGIQELVIVPHLLLHQIPFAALPIEGSPAMLGEKFTVRFIPSCQILKYCVDRPAITTTIQGLVEDADETLIGARYEGYKIAEICEVKVGDRLRGKTQATVANYRQLLSRINRLHSSHHAASRWDNPLESALKLGDGNITLGDLLLGERYPNLDEVFLSACETHVGQYTLTDDVATITTGFLCAGARSVQSTLWSVSDLVTALFDIFYHQERREGYNRAISLKRAQVRLKNLSGEEFKLNYAQEILDFVAEQIASLSEEIDRLQEELAEVDLDDPIWNPVFVKQTKLSELKKLQKVLPETLQAYSAKPYPFAAPYYWAGFICQGMA